MAAQGLSARLLAAPVTALAQRALGDADAWVVGGAVRAAALAKEVQDLDIAIAGGEDSAARALAREAGGFAFPLSDRFGTWRVVDRERRAVADLTRLRGATIEDDLGARDFTVGAVAVPLRGGPPLDPHGGLADLERGQLRAVSPRAFADDPVRLLRAARLGAELGLEPVPETA